MRDLVCGFLLLDEGPQYDNTEGMPLIFISSGYHQLFVQSALAFDDIQTILTAHLKAKCKLRQMTCPARK